MWYIAFEKGDSYMLSSQMTYLHVKGPYEIATIITFEKLDLVDVTMITFEIKSSECMGQLERWSYGIRGYLIMCNDFA
jgi:hypothetical protein